ncbi:hypothetical protein IAT40_000580 [Kwoniella sp. CBS 6097]
MPTLVLRQVDPNLSATSSSSATSASSTSSSSPSPSGAPWVNGAPTGSSTTLYLFTFLITILVLGLISSALLLRAYILRRRFHRRVEEALRAGRPLPPDAAAALGLGPRRTGLGARGKKEKKHGLMPTMWESQMRRDIGGEKQCENQHEEVDVLLEKEESSWDDLTPLSVLHFPPNVPPPPPEPIQMPPPPSTATIIRSMFSTRSPYPERPQLIQTITSQTIPTSRPVFSVPDAGTEIVVGVMIAMPVEEGSAAEEKWSLLEDGEERDLPEVCLGVMSAKIGE